MVELCALLRRHFLAKQEEDHGRRIRAMPLRAAVAAKTPGKLTI
jgi:hypothetical protein